MPKSKKPKSRQPVQDHEHDGCCYHCVLYHMATTLGPSRDYRLELELHSPPPRPSNPWRARVTLAALLLAVALLSGAYGVNKGWDAAMEEPCPDCECPEDRFDERWSAPPLRVITATHPGVAPSSSAR